MFSCRGLAGALAAASLAGLVLGGPGAGAQTLDEALAAAYGNNPRLLAARAQLRATDESIAQALAGWRPTVEFSYDAGRRLTSTNGASARARTPRSAALNITQNLYQGGQTLATTRRSEYDIQADRARLIAVEQQVMRDAAAAYMDVVRDQAVLRLTENNVRVLQRQLEATQDRFEVGEVTRTDVAQAESRLSRARSDRIRAEGDLEQSRADYRAVIGDMPGTLEPAEPLGDLPASEDEAQQLARDNNPDVVTARFDERSAAANVEVVHAGLLPTVDLEGELRRSDDTSATVDRSETAEILARLNIPLYQAGAVGSRVREAKQVAGQRRRELEQAVRSAVQTATQTWEILTTTRSQIRAFDSEVRAAEIALEGVRQEAQVGSRTVLDVLDAEQELLDARVNLVRARRDEVVASFDLRRAIGGLTAADLDLAVERYDFEKHYRAVRGRWWDWDTDTQE